MIPLKGCVVPRGWLVVGDHLLSKRAHNIRVEQRQLEHLQPVAVQQATVRQDLPVRYAKQQESLLRHPALGVQRALGRYW